VIGYVFHSLWAMFFAVFMVHLFSTVALTFGLPAMLLWAVGLTACTLGFYQGSTFTQYLDGAFSPGVQLSVWRCGPLHAHPGYSLMAALVFFQASACALRFLPRTGFGTFSGAVFAWICSIAQLRWRSLQPPKLCAVSLSASSTSLAVLGGASQLQSGGSPLQFACCVADLLTVLAWCALQAVLSSAAVVLYSCLVPS
jgi:hypothetical protein